MLSVQEQVKKILNSAKIPALSMCWHQEGETKAFTGGVTDASNPIPVDSTTLFQAASLSKPVSAAIVLDLVEQNKWDLNTPLADIMDYDLQLKNDPHYKKLTTRMVLGQCSGLPNWFGPEDEIKFIATPETEFNYSGVAFEFLKRAIEQKTQKKWEEIAQAFFDKAGMKNSTFKKLPASHLKNIRCVARAHQGDGTPCLDYPMDLPEIPAGSLLTTANDYVAFLQYCFVNNYLRSTLFKGKYQLNKKFPETPFAEEQIQWGLGMGIFTDAKTKEKIAFHWGTNTGSYAFCSINLRTGDCVACFVNSENGPNVFQKLSEAVIGDMSLLFQWLSNYCAFKAVSQPKSSFSGTELFQLVSQQHKNVPASSHAMRSLISTNLGFFRQLEDQYLTEHRHDDPQLQHEYDKRFALVLKK